MIHYHKLRNVEWKHVEERFKKYKLIGEKIILSLDERLVLNNTVSSNMVLYTISFF
jgi:hypothetical protein